MTKFRIVKDANSTYWPQMLVGPAWVTQTKLNNIYLTEYGYPCLAAAERDFYTFINTFKIEVIREYDTDD